MSGLKIEADLRIDHAWVLSLNADFDEYTDGSIIVHDGKFLQIGNYSDCQDVPVKKILDASGKIIMPPFFNCHSHSPMSLFRGLGNDVPLQTWLEKYIWPMEARHINEKNVRLGSLLSILEMIQSGTNIFADMYFFEREVGKVASELGFRAILGEALLDFPTPNSATPEACLAYNERIMQEFSSDSLISFSIPSHAPYTCSKEVLKSAASFSAKHKIPATIHLAETQEEVTAHIRQHGVTPARYLADLGYFDYHAVCYHCNHLSSDDIRIFKEYDVSVVTLPNSNSKLASGIAPVHELLEAGICVGLGTDGAASNNNSSMLKELQIMLKLQKVKHLDPTILTAKQAIQIATLNGARAYRKESELGSLEAGKMADLIIIGTEAPHMQPMYDPYAQIAYAMHNEDIKSLMINGVFVMQDRVISGADQAALSMQMESFVQDLNID